MKCEEEDEEMQRATDLGKLGGKIKGIGVGEKWFGKNKMGKKREEISSEILGFL